MNKIPLLVDQRVETGKGAARRLRSSGKIPAILYGHKAEPVNLVLGLHEFKKALEHGGTNPIFELEINADKKTTKRSAILKEKQTRPLDSFLLHLDFLEVSMEETLEFNVPLEFSGEPIGAEKGGTFQPLLRELRIACLANDIPRVITVDISHLEVGHAIHVSDVPLPPGVSAVDDLGTAVATLLAPKKEEKEIPDEEASKEVPQST
jgi:large subunit ribosomal protein L25